MLEESARAGHRLLEVSHVAHRWSVSQEFVRRLIRSGQLPARLIGSRWRLEPHDVQAYYDRQQQARHVDDDCLARRAFPQPKGA